MTVESVIQFAETIREYDEAIEKQTGAAPDDRLVVITIGTAHVVPMWPGVVKTPYGAATVRAIEPSRGTVDVVMQTHRAYYGAIKLAGILGDDDG